MALRSLWSSPFPQHPRAAGGGGGHRRWRCFRRACRRRGGEQWTTVRTTRARTRQRVAPAAAAAAAAAVPAAAAAAAWRPCYFLAPPRHPPPRAIDGFFPPPPPLWPHIPPPPHPPRRRRARAHRAARPRVCAAASDDCPASVGRWLLGWWRPCLGGSRRPPRRWRPLLTLRWVRQKPLAVITYPPLGRRKSAGLRGACGWPLPTSERVPPRRQRLPLVRAAVDAAAAVGGAPPTPARGGHVGDRHHRHHGRLPRLLLSDLPLVRALSSGAGRAGDAHPGGGA